MADDELFKIEIHDTLDSIITRLNDFAADQLPFAMAGALYDVAVDAREEMRRQLPKVFTIRQPKPWAARALTFDTLNKKTLRNKIKSGGEPSISITSRDEVLGPLLTDGGTKTHRGAKTRDGVRHDGEFGVPIIGGARKSAKTIIRPGRNSPRDFIENKNAFIITAKDGRRLMVMPPKKYRKGVPKAAQHKALFHMRAKVQIKPWWNARNVLLTAMVAQLPDRFVANFNRALATRRSGK